MEDVKKQYASADGGSGCAKDMKRKHERRDTNADRRRSC